MKKIIGIIFILSCFLNLNLDAASNANLFKKMRSRFSTQAVKKSESKSKSYNFKKEFSDESFQVTFLEEPNEFYYKFTEGTYNLIISQLSESADDDDEDDYDFYPEIDYDVLFPKESHSYLVFDENLDCFHFLSVSRLQKSQDRVAESISTLMVDWKKYCVSENEEDMDEEYHFEYTPMKKDENGYSMTELFYSYTFTDIYDDEDDEEEYVWGKIVITQKNIYYLFYCSAKNNSQMNKKASKFLSSFEVNKK